MIKHNGKDISKVSLGALVIGKVIYGSKVVWEYITSCFGKGYWLNSYGWKNDKGWKNNK